jgi:hypothetical protein
MEQNEEEYYGVKRRMDTATRLASKGQCPMSAT